MRNPVPIAVLAWEMIFLALSAQVAGSPIGNAAIVASCLQRLSVRIPARAARRSVSLKMLPVTPRNAVDREMLTQDFSL